MQVTALYRRGVVRPLDARAADQLFSYGIKSSLRCEWVPILGDDQFRAISNSGFLRSLSAVCQVDLSDYEEARLEVDRIPAALEVIKANSAAVRDRLVLDFFECVAGLMTDALREKTDILFVL